VADWLVALLVGVVIQLIGVVFFLGRMSQQIKVNTDRLTRLEEVGSPAMGELRVQLLDLKETLATACAYARTHSPGER
jgi:hypothetical protein